MNVLIACEQSGRVRDQFILKGHNAISCDVLASTSDNDNPHIIGDALEVIRSQKWDLIIAFPPCTYLTAGGAVRMYPKAGQIDPIRYKKAIEAKKLFMSIYESDCEKIAIENPKPLRVVGLPQKTQVIQPYEFGEPYSKMTYLWLKGLPNLQPTNVLTEYQPLINGGGGRLNGKNYAGKSFASGSKARSLTFMGIAQAMANQWG